MSDFQIETIARIQAQSENKTVSKTAYEFMQASLESKYSYNFTWQGRPIIQYPQDIVAMQELIWLVKPDLIIETGIAHGGSLIFSASMLAQLDICDAIDSRSMFDPTLSHRKVLAVDIDIREHNKKAIESHPMSSRIEMIQGSSIDKGVVEKVKNYAKNYKKIMVCLDSNHTHEHVLSELEVYAPLTSVESYCVIFDTIVEDMPKELSLNRPWEPGDNPKTAVWQYLKTHPEFVIDESIQNKLAVTVAPDGYLKRTR